MWGANRETTERRLGIMHRMTKDQSNELTGTLLDMTREWEEDNGQNPRFKEKLLRRTEVAIEDLFKRVCPPEEDPTEQCGQVRPEIVAVLDPRDRELGRIVLEAAADLEAGDGHYAHEKNVVVGAVRRIWNVFESESWTYTARDGILGSQTFKDLVGELLDHEQLSPEALFGAYIAMVRSGQVANASKASEGTDLTLVDWEYLCRELEEMRQRKRGRRGVRAKAPEEWGEYPGSGDDVPF